MKLSKQKLQKIIEQVVVQKLMNEGVYQDPLVAAFERALHAVEDLGSMLPADDPSFAEVENAVLSLVNAHEMFVGDA